MKTIFFVCAICLQLQWSYGKPDGVGAYAYQDSTGNRAFAQNAEQHKKALNAARKAFDLTSNNAGYVPNFDTGFSRFPGFPNFEFPQPDYMGRFGGMPDFGNFPLPMPSLNSFAENSAFAGGAVAPGYRHQQVALSPSDPNQPNIDVTKFSESGRSNSPQFYSVQSSSFVTSANVNGQQKTNKGGETIVNENGKITKYSLNN
ncbi:hypothetical protein O0L34_g9450 [Tuta absoluta]|nr:hypothetical protein O0L34_g9450 [Tuta absoluta]